MSKLPTFTPEDDEYLKQIEADNELETSVQLSIAVIEAEREATARRAAELTSQMMSEKLEAINAKIEVMLATRKKETESEIKEKIDAIVQIELEAKIITGRAELEIRIRSEVEATIRAEVTAKIRAEVEAEAKVRAEVEVEARIKALAEKDAEVIAANAATKAALDSLAVAEARAATVVKELDAARDTIVDPSTTGAPKKRVFEGGGGGGGGGAEPALGERGKKDTADGATGTDAKYFLKKLVGLKRLKVGSVDSSTGEKVEGKEGDKFRQTIFLLWKMWKIDTRIRSITQGNKILENFWEENLYQKRYVIFDNGEEMRLTKADQFLIKKFFEKESDGKDAFLNSLKLAREVNDLIMQKRKEGMYEAGTPDEKVLKEFFEAYLQPKTPDSRTTLREARLRVVKKDHFYSK